MSNRSPTPEQVAIIDEVRGSSQSSLLVTAFAGCAKTTTLSMAANAATEPNILALAFNVSAKQALESSLPSTTCTIKTFNGLGHAAWGKALGKRLILDDKKLGKLVTSVAKDQGLVLTPEEWGDVRAITSRAMLWGLVPMALSRQFPGLVPDTPETWQDLADEVWAPGQSPTLALLAREVLTQSIKLSFSGVISFDDQLYMSTMFGGVFPRYPLVLVDESQDLSPLNHIQLRKSATERLLAVGDPCQSIYAFRGADISSMPNLRRLRRLWTDLPLATTFRCPKLIVARQQHHAPSFKAWYTNPEGAFSTFTKDTPWSWPMVERHHTDGSVAILCRNNAPLIKMAFKLIRQGIGCTMLGRDIGKGLQRLLAKICPNDQTPAAQCTALIMEWIGRETSLAEANGKEHTIPRITDQGECLLAVLESHPCRDRRDLERALIEVFQSTGQVTLSTIHKAKGLEYNTVIHLDPWRLPSKQALKADAAGNPSPLAQERNLAYVCETRTKHTLLEANVGDFV